MRNRKKGLRKVVFVLLAGLTLVGGCSMQKPAVDEYLMPEPPTAMPTQVENTALAAEMAAAQERRILEEARQLSLLRRQAEKAAALEEREQLREQEEARRREEEERKAEEARKAEEERLAREAQEREEAARLERERSGIIEGEHGILMGEFTTSFSGSSQGRIHNIQTAAERINGTVLADGEAFSCQSALAPFTEENGYQTAGAYMDGKVIQSVGGGVCQISTTLYNAVLEAELSVTERAPHSMTVSYVEVSRDAAIAGDYKDFCFRNSSGADIYIEGRATDAELTFRIWGADTKKKDGREISFETVILETIEPGEDIVTEDAEQPSDYHKVKQAAHTGYRAQLYKLVYQDGEEIDRLLINESSYEAAPAYVIVGTGD